MTYVYKDYKVKMKMVQDQLLPLNEVFMGLQYENCYLEQGE